MGRRRNEGGVPRRGVYGTGIISCRCRTATALSVAARPVGEKTGRGNQTSERSTPRFCWLCYGVSQTTPSKRHAAGLTGRALIVGSRDQQGLRRWSASHASWSRVLGPALGLRRRRLCQKAVVWAFGSLDLGHLQRQAKVGMPPVARIRTPCSRPRGRGGGYINKS